MERTRERFEFSGLSAMQPRTLRYGSLDWNTDTCVADCDADAGCSFVTATADANGSTTCRFGSSAALASMVRVPDDNSRGVVVRSGRKLSVPPVSPPPEGVIEGFDGNAETTHILGGPVQQWEKTQIVIEKPLYTRKLSSKKSMNDVIDECNAVCLKDPNCMVMAAHNPKRGDSVCQFGTAADIDGTRKQDDRWHTSIMPERAPPESFPDTVQTGRKFDFEHYRKIPYKSSKSHMDASHECAAECVADPECRIMATNNPKTGSTMCYLGKADQLTRFKATADDRWNSGIFSEKAPADRGAPDDAGRTEPQIFDKTRIEFKMYRRKDVDGGTGTRQVLDQCMQECDADPDCRVVAVHNQKRGATVCEFGKEGDIGGNRKGDDRWVSAIMPPKPPPDELVGKIQKGQKYDFKSYKKIPYGSGVGLDKVAAKCAAQCQDDPECRIMAANNPKNGSSICHLGDAKALEDHKVSSDSRWYSATYEEKEIPGGTPEIGYKYNFRAYKDTQKSSDRHLPDVLQLCKAECIADPKCHVVTAYNPKSGANKCFFGDKNAADPEKMTKQKDDRWASALVDKSPQEAEKDARAPGEGQRYNFAAYKDKEYDAGRPLAEVLELCKKECVDDRKCRIVAAEQTKVGPNKCYFGDVVAMQQNVAVEDDRWLSAIVDEKPPREPGVGQKYGFSPFRDISYDPGRPIAEVLELCKKECAIDRKCRIVGVEAPESGPNKCYLGDEASFLKHTVTDDDRWMSATLPPKQPLPDGYQMRYDFKSYKSELVDSSLPLVEVHEQCKSMCRSDDQCAVVATNDTLTGPYKCVFGNVDSLAAMKKVEDVNWVSSLLPRTKTAAVPPAARPAEPAGAPASAGSSAAGPSPSPGTSRPMTDEEKLIAEYMQSGMSEEEARRQAKIDLENRTSLFGFEDGDPIENMPPPYEREQGGMGMGVMLVLTLFACAAAVLVLWMLCAWLGVGTRP